MLTDNSPYKHTLGAALHAYNEIVLISGAAIDVKAVFGAWNCMLITNMCFVFGMSVTGLTL